MPSILLVDTLASYVLAIYAQALCPKQTGTALRRYWWIGVIGLQWIEVLWCRLVSLLSSCSAQNNVLSLDLSIGIALARSTRLVSAVSAWMLLCGNTELLAQCPYFRKKWLTISRLDAITSMWIETHAPDIAFNSLTWMARVVSPSSLTLPLHD